MSSKLFFNFKLGKNAKMEPIPNCHTLNGDKKNIACLGTEWPLKIKNKVKLKEKIEIKIIASSL